MTCNEIRELISSMIDNELTPEDSAVVTEHLAECPECMRVFEAFHTISLSLDELEDVPEGFTEAVMHRINTPAPVKKRKPIYMRLATLAACFALVVFTGSQFITSHLHTDDRRIQDTAQYARVAHQTPRPTATPTPEVTEELSAMPVDDGDAAENQAPAVDVSPMVETAEVTPTPTPVPMPTATPVPVTDALLPTELTALNQLLMIAEAADMALFEGEPQYTITVQDENGTDVVLFVWTTESRIYCKDPVNETAWYAVGTPQQLVSLLDLDTPAEADAE